MPGARAYPTNGFPLSKAELAKTLDLGNPVYEFLEHYAKRDVVFFFDDFGQKALNTTNDWSVAAGNTATTWARVAGTSGLLRGVAGTTAATSGLQIYGANKDWNGTLNSGMEIRFRDSVILEGRLEMGFVDALAAVNTNLVNSMSTPTFNTVATAALFMYDHTGSTITQGLYTDGSGVSAQKTAITSGLTAATFTTVRIQIIGQTVHLWIDGTFMTSLTSGITAADTMVPCFASKSSDTTDRNINIDFIGVWSDRA